MPSIRAATNCVARETLNDSQVVDDYGRGDIQEPINRALNSCVPELRFMMAEQDRIYGSGSGRGFYDGPYHDDLPRAVLARIRRELDRRRADEEQRQAAARAEAERQQAAQQAEAERQRVARQAEDERQQAEHKAEVAKLDAERQAEQLRLETLKRQRLAAAEGADNILRDRFLECANKQLADIVKSGEPAEVLATATMTLCGTEVDQFLTGFIEARKIERDLGTLNEVQKTSIMAAGRDKIRDQVVALAVKAKAARATGSSF